MDDSRVSKNKTCIANPISYLNDRGVDGRMDETFTVKIINIALSSTVNFIIVIEKLLYLLDTFEVLILEKLKSKQILVTLAAKMSTRANIQENKIGMRKAQSMMLLIGL